jgi:amino acid transporter
MIGIGPLITIPLVVSTLHGPLSLAAWVLGAVVAACDGLVWAELGAALPRSGGLYAFFLQLFGERAGRLLAFLYVWQFVITTPFLLASGYIGFAQYAGYIVPALRANEPMQHALAAILGLATIVLLSRRIDRVAAISFALFIIATATIFIVTLAGWAHFQPQRAFTVEPGSTAFLPFVAGLGSGLIVTLYDYLGYNTVTSIGEEIIAPPRTMPRSILLAIGMVAALYFALQTGVLGAVPWRELVDAKFVASTIAERAWGTTAAGVVTILVLLTAFASTFALLLAASRVPFAAARDALFLSAFARLHPRNAYPTVALVTIGGLALPACFLPLDQIIAVIGVGIVVFAGVGAFASIVRLRRTAIAMPYRMPLFPLPPVLALLAWIYVLASAGAFAVGFTALSIVAGCALYLFAGYSRSRTVASAGNDTS